jgi:hypothetical protein
MAAEDSRNFTNGVSASGDPQDENSDVENGVNRHPLDSLVTWVSMEEDRN